MLTKETYKANYYHDEADSRVYYHARPARLCGTSALIREYNELDAIGFDTQELFVRLRSIKRELNRRGVEV